MLMQLVSDIESNVVVSQCIGFVTVSRLARSSAHVLLSVRLALALVCVHSTFYALLCSMKARWIEISLAL